MSSYLSSEELIALIRSVFSLQKSDKKLAILIDVPDRSVPDSPLWRERRIIAKHWQRELIKGKNDLGLDEVNLVAYPNVHSNNANLPEKAYVYGDDIEKIDAEKLEQSGHALNFDDILSSHQIMIALTELSATAPLKLSATKFGFRAVTMPGFSKKMIPALRLDYETINNRILALKNILDPATDLEIVFKVGDSGYRIFFDLRFREAHASSGRFPNAGTAGNLPGGECYIVPYEGERGEASRSEGILPVQFEDEIVIYQIEQNIARQVISEGRYSSIERNKIHDEPAYANIAEIGFGILRDFGIKPIGEILLDEKLGLHIAFGRSDHFGGAVGIKNFTSPEKVIHIDRIFIPETQPEIEVKSVTAIFENSKKIIIMKNGNYEIF